MGLVCYAHFLILRAQCRENKVIYLFCCLSDNWFLLKLTENIPRWCQALGLKCERKIAFFAVLRTQLKMFGSFKGAEVAALLETIEQTAREYMADTRLYYKFLIEKYCPFVKRQEKGKDISSMEEINDFLPWADNWAAYEKDGREKESILTTIARNI